jgi:hypothetical protein
MIRITITHWTGATIVVEGKYATTGMGRGGQSKFRHAMDEVAIQLTGNAFKVEMEEIENIQE